MMDEGNNITEDSYSTIMDEGNNITESSHLPLP